MQLPDRIAGIVAGRPYTENHTGMSGSRVLMYDEYVLKIEKTRPEDLDTIAVMRWLEGQIPVPRIAAYERKAGFSYTLMSRVQGRMACDEYYLERPEELATLLAEALRMLWSVNTAGCPRERSIDTELAEARCRVEQHMVDMDNVEPETFGPGGFSGPEELLGWLYDHRPPYEPVLSHGDFCLPNIYLDNGKISGFIDLGDTGIGDKWRDIALCYRSLKHNAEGIYGGKVYSDTDPMLLFKKLQIEPDWDKIRFYLLMDELF
jgi:kanamycin kinase/aminoglycoside 3'-phosphotransferase-3